MTCSGGGRVIDGNVRVRTQSEAIVAGFLRDEVQYQSRHGVSVQRIHGKVPGLQPLKPDVDHGEHGANVQLRMSGGIRSEIHLGEFEQRRRRTQPGPLFSVLL